MFSIRFLCRVITAAKLSVKWFHSLHTRQIDGRLLASVVDNISSNGPMNHCLVFSKQPGARNMQIGCSGHVPNLVAQDVTATLGLAPPVAEKDLFEDTRKFAVVYDPAEDPVVVVAEMELMEEDLKAVRASPSQYDVKTPKRPQNGPSKLPKFGRARMFRFGTYSRAGRSAVGGNHLNRFQTAAVQADGAESDADVSQEDEEPVASTRVKGTVKAQSSGKKGKKAKAKKVFTVVDKVTFPIAREFWASHYFQIHASVVHILHSEM
ncbi:hypothetical protein B0H11DRAFT_1916660 [Mycena galericulata]|nr:hypothetical protein B0H11DRAFT_1916660 [Mycena galericulata]